jgi:eukaryotic-like serine/threonine-protein kinase
LAEEESRGSLAPGAMIAGRFRVDRIIGRGGMGEVYAAKHVTTGKEVALKLIHSASGVGKEHTRRFMREARAATAIDHPNVIEVFDVFEDENGTPVMVMELLKGESLSAYRQRVGAMKLHEVVTILVPALEAVRAAHAKGIVHRDLKPDNIFLANTSAGRTTKVLDFGIAKVLDPAKISSETQGQQTNTGSILGTPHYMSFEQAMSDKQVDHRTDIWAMGVILFEALTGRRPMEFDTLGQMYVAFLQGTVPSILAAVPDLPRDVADAIDRALAKEREARLDDLGPLIAALARYGDATTPGALAGGTLIGELSTSAATNAPLSTSAATPSQTRRSRSPILIGAGVIGAAAIGVFVFVSRGGAKSDLPIASAAAGASTPVTSASALDPIVVDAATLPSESASPSVLASIGASQRRPPRGAAGANPLPISSAPPTPPPAATPPKRGISEKLPY